MLENATENCRKIVREQKQKMEEKERQSKKVDRKSIETLKIGSVLRKTESFRLFQVQEWASDAENKRTHVLVCECAIESWCSKADRKNQK